MRRSNMLTRADRAALDAASNWILRLQEDGADERDVSEWLEWHAESANGVAFEEMQVVEEELRDLDASAKQLLVDRFVVEVPHSRVDRAAWWRGWRAGMAVSVLAVFALALLGTNVWLSPERTNGAYRTDRASHRVVELADGSVVHLGASSSLSFNFTREARYLVLENGEALFKVAKDPARPFIVQAGAAQVRAVGTEFNVRRSLGDTYVAVREGVVMVTQTGRSAPDSPLGSISSSPASGADVGEQTGRAVRLSAGQLGETTYVSHAISVVSIAPSAIAGWREGRLEFVNEPLVSVVATINRYSNREIVLTDPIAASSMRFTGVVVEDHIDDWARAIPSVFPLEVS